MSNKSGFYRVHRQKSISKTLKGDKVSYYWEYRVDNRLVKKSIKNKKLILLKLKVIEADLDWGIIDLEKAQKNAKRERTDIKDLQGRYGIQIGGD